jgi:hypothetical protein
VSAWFYWMPGHRGPEARLAYSHLSGDDRSRALAVHPLTDEDREAVRQGKDEASALEILARRYRPPAARARGPIKGLQSL